MKKISAILLCGVCPLVFGQIGIKTDKPHLSSDLELGSTNKALYLNRVSNPENEISSPQNGMILYDTTLKCVRAYQADSWSKCLGVPGGEQGTVVSLECTSATHSGGSLVSGTSYTGSSRTTTVSYTGGNSGSYPAMNINSTGVTGLTAELAAGTLSNGSGSLMFNITGTPSGVGTASFAITIGNKTCSFVRIVEAMAAQGCVGNEYLIYSGQKAVKFCGQIWMRHNLGADTSLSPDTNPQSQALIGNYYLWGRKNIVANGYTASGSIPGFNSAWIPDVPVTTQSWNSGTETVPVKTSNDPCPTGFRVPTVNDFNVLMANMQNIEESYGTDWTENSNNYSNGRVVKNGPVQLTFPATGHRRPTNQGELMERGFAGSYYTSTALPPSGTGNFYVKDFGVLKNEMGVSAGSNSGNRGRNLKCIAQ